MDGEVGRRVVEDAGSLQENQTKRFYTCVHALHTAPVNKV